MKLAYFVAVKIMLRKGEFANYFTTIINNKNNIIFTNIQFVG